MTMSMSMTMSMTMSMIMSMPMSMTMSMTMSGRCYSTKVSVNVFTSDERMEKNLMKCIIGQFHRDSRYSFGNFTSYTLLVKK